MGHQLQPLPVLDKMSLLLKSRVRGHRSSNSHPVPANVDLAYSEGRLDSGGPWVICFRCWCCPAVQHITASAGGGTHGHLGKKNKAHYKK